MTDWNDNRAFSALLRRAARAASVAAHEQGLLTEAFRERYGTTYSDVDADELIEPLDYGGVRAPTVAECDRVMADAGYPKDTQ